MKFATRGLHTKHLSICKFLESQCKGRPNYSYGHKLQLQFCAYFRINPSLLPSLTHSSLSLPQGVVTFCYSTATINVKVIPLQAWTGPEGSRFHDNWHMKVVSPMHRPPLPPPPKKYSWYSFLLEAVWTPGNSAAGRIMSMKKSTDTIPNRTHALLACSGVSQSNAPPHTLHRYCTLQKIMLL